MQPSQRVVTTANEMSLQVLPSSTPFLLPADDGADNPEGIRAQGAQLHYAAHQLFTVLIPVLHLGLSGFGQAPACSMKPVLHRDLSRLIL